MTDAAKGVQRSTITNKAGLYQFLDIPPGDYRLEATASGFAAYLVEKVTLVVKTPSTIDIRLQPAGVKTSVEVEGHAPLINRTDASLGNTLENDQISELRARNFSRDAMHTHTRSGEGEDEATLYHGVWTFP